MSDASVWYRNGWVWLVIMIPASSVMFGVVMLVSASLYPDDLVADDYYKEGMAINEIIGREERAVQLGIEVRLGLENSGVVLYTLADDSAIALSLRHVVDRGRDIEVVMVPEADGRYSAVDPLLVSTLGSSGIWYLEVAGVDDDWLVRERIETPLEGVVRILP